METKTTVTKGSVSESEQNQSQGPSGEGKIPLSEKEIEARVRENLRSEYERKTEALSEKYDEMAFRYNQLEEKLRLTDAQRAEKERLARGLTALEEQANILKTDPQYAAYNHVMKEIAGASKDEAVNEAVSKAVHEIRVDDAKRFVNRSAKELGVKPEELQEEINDYLAEGYSERELNAGIFRHSNLDPLTRAERAFEDLSRRKALIKREAELKRSEGGESLEGDGNGNNAPASNKIPFSKLGNSSPKDMVQNLMRLGAIKQDK